MSEERVWEGEVGGGTTGIKNSVLSVSVKRGPPGRLSDMYIGSSGGRGNLRATGRHVACGSRAQNEVTWEE